MDATFIEGAAAFIASLIVFVGSAFFLLAMVMGARLAYFVTASVTLGFTLILGIVWSLPSPSPLGPVGQLPEWNPLEIGADASELQAPSASEYPEGPWQPVDEEDEAELTKKTELETSAQDYLEQSIDEGKTDAFESAEDAQIDTDATRVLEQGGKEYGAVTYTPLPGKEGTKAVAAFEYDPGNPLGPARQITVGTALLLGLHLYALSRSERRAQALAQTQES